MISNSLKPKAYKIIFLGEPNVGKTTLINQITNKYDTRKSARVTTSLDFAVIDNKIYGHDDITHLWDTAGQEKYDGLSKSLFRWPNCVILMYDVNDNKSLLRIKKYWLPIVYDLLETGERECDVSITPIILLGNKCDLMNKDTCSRYDFIYENLNNYIYSKERSNVEYVPFIFRDILRYDSRESYEENKYVYNYPTYISNPLIHNDFYDENDKRYVVYHRFICATDDNTLKELYLNIMKYTRKSIIEKGIIYNIDANTIINHGGSIHVSIKKRRYKETEKENHMNKNKPSKLDEKKIDLKCKHCLLL